MEDGGGRQGALPPSAVALYSHGLPAARFPGRPDRQTAVFRWLVTEVFCQAGGPLALDMERFQVLVRSFR